MKKKISLSLILCILWGGTIGTFLQSYFNSAKLYKTLDGIIGLPHDAVSSIVAKADQDMNSRTIDSSSVTVWVKSDWLLELRRNAIVDAYTNVFIILFVTSLFACFWFRNNKKCEQKDARDAVPSPQI